mgnify:CR=1 FL=1
MAARFMVYGMKPLFWRIEYAGGAGLAASAVNTATTVVCPVYTGVIWRVNVSYRLGL